MINFYQFDDGGIYSGTIQHDPMLPVPKNSTTKSPPELEGDEVAKWLGGSWELLSSRPAENLQPRKDVLSAKCKADRDAKTYSNETVPFPVTEHEIKTSNEIDIRNLVSKMLAATAIIQAGGGAGDYRYVTAAKVRVSLTVQQFSTAALAIMAIKDAIFYQYDDLRLLIDAATTQSELDNIEADWPS